MWKYAAILKPDKGNDLARFDKLEHLFIDKKKFKQIDKDPTITQLSTLQKYLRSLFKRGESTEEQYEKLDYTKPLQCY